MIRHDIKDLVQRLLFIEPQFLYRYEILVNGSIKERSVILHIFFAA